jgi:hypothetical protein
MNKYKIEGEINFFDELYKSLDIEDTNHDEDNKCLISNTLLTDKFVELKCGHKFNYVPLYNDLINHRTKFNAMEGGSTRLNLNEIRCPYCRNKQDTLLPYYEEFGLHKVNGVNFYEETLKHKTNYKKCDFEIQNDKYDDKIIESLSNKKYNYCCKPFSTQITEYNDIVPSEPIFIYNDNKYYCYEHKRMMIKKYKLEKKAKIMEEKKQIKAQIKEQLKAEKEKAKEESKNAKQQVKTEKQQAKESKNAVKDDTKASKTNGNENIILGPLTIENQTNGCVQILKTGIHKGTSCGCKVISENLCKRHYLLIHKELSINN